MPTETPKKKTASRTAPPLAAVDAVPTSPEAWGRSSSANKADGFVVELPSGNFAKIRRTLDLPTLLRSGQIPNPLAGIVRKSMAEGDPNILRDISQKDSGPVLEQLLDLMDSVVCKSMIEPPVSRPEIIKGESFDEYSERTANWNPEPGTISIFAIDTSDKLYIFAVSQGMATDLASFRSQASAVVLGVPAEPSVQRAPKPTSRTGGGKSKSRSRTKS